MFSTSSLFHVTNSQTDISNCLTINLGVDTEKLGQRSLFNGIMVEEVIFCPRY